MESEGLELVLRVLGNRAPVVGARIVIGKKTRAITDADGVARVAGIPPKYLDARVFADGFAPGYVWAFLEEDPGGVVEQVVKLEPGAVVEGVVLGPDERPVPNAEVELWHGVEGHWLDTANADEDGRWRLNAVAIGKYRLTASAKSSSRGSEVTIECNGQTPTHGVVVRVDAGGRVRGVVTNASGDLVADAAIIAILRGVTSDEARTGVDGRFELDGLRIGDYDIAAKKDADASPAVRVTLRHNEPVDVELVLQHARIAGKVIDENGTPVEAAQVAAIPSSRFSTSGFHTMVATDAEGQFDFGGLEPGEYVVSARWHGQRTLRRDAQQIAVKTGGEPVTLTIVKLGSIGGRVRLDGAPMPYLGVLLTDEPDFPSNGVKPIGVRTIDGRFCIRGVDRGTWGLVLIGPGTELKTFRAVAVGDGEDVDLGEIDMERGQRVAGVVRDEAGVPVGQARVVIGPGIGGIPSSDRTRLHHAFGAQYETTTDADGGYVFAGISAHRPHMRAPHVLATHWSRGSSLIQELPTGDSNIDLQLRSTGTIAGTVEGFRGRMLFVNASRADEPEGARWTSVRDGRFSFVDVPAGEYRINLEPPTGVASDDVVVLVRSDEVVAAKLAMRSALVRLSVLVDWGTAKQLRLLRVGADEGKAKGPILVLDESCVFEDFEPGDYRAVVDGVSGRSFTVDKEPPEQTVDLRSRG